MHFTDSHCHLDFDALQTNFAKLLTSCSNKNIKRIIIPTIGPDNWQKTLDLAKNTDQHNKPQLLPCLGIHPWFLNILSETSLQALTSIAHKNQNKIVAIGETGLDGNIAKKYKNMDKQILFFEHQISLAKQLNKALIIHHYKAHQEVTSLLKKSDVSQGVIHGFSGSFQQAKNYIDLGFKLGVGGTITYERAQKTIKTIAKVPLSSLVLETDAPAMPLAGFQGTHNSPLRLINVFEKICEIRAEPPEELATTLEKNVNQLFGLN